MTTIHPTWRRAAANLAMLGLLAGLLTACTLSSETNLIGPGEAVQPLPASFSMTSYEPDPEAGIYTRSTEAPAPFSLEGEGYVVADGSMIASFAPTDAPDTFVVALTSNDGTTYGVARLRSGLMEVAVIYDESAATQFAASGTPVPAGVTLSTVAGGGVTLADRAALDAMVALHRAGTISLAALVVHVGPGEAPATLRREGDWYVPE